MTALKSVALLLLGLMWTISGAQANQLRGKLEIQVSVDSEGDLQKREVIFSPEYKGSIGTFGDLTFIGNLRADLEDKLEPGQPQSSNSYRDDFNQRAFIGNTIDAEIRELYVDMYIEDMFVRVGKQQVVWGQADGLRVLDAVNPLHFREFIIGDFDTRRIPTWMVNIEKPLGAAVMQFLWIPDKTYNDIPQQGTFAFRSTQFTPSLFGELPQTLGSVTLEKPNRLFKDDDVGIRVNGFHSGWDWSLNYLYVYDDSAVTRRTHLGDHQFRLSQRFERTHIVGASASNAFGKNTVRAEVGYFSDQYYVVDQPDDSDGIASAKEISYVLGLDHQFNGDLLISTQLFQSVVFDAPSTLRRAQWETSLTFLVRHTFFNERAELEALLITDIDEGDGALQVSYQYEYSDSLLLGLSTHIFYGDDIGFYGQFNGNDAVSLLLSYHF